MGQSPSDPEHNLLALRHRLKYSSLKVHVCVCRAGGRAGYIFENIKQMHPHFWKSLWCLIDWLLFTLGGGSAQRVKEIFLRLTVLQEGFQVYSKLA